MENKRVTRLTTRKAKRRKKKKTKIGTGQISNRKLLQQKRDGVVESKDLRERTISPLPVGGKKGTARKTKLRKEQANLKGEKKGPTSQKLGGRVSGRKGSSLSPLSERHAEGSKHIN